MEKGFSPHSGQTIEETLPKQQARDVQIDRKYMDRFQDIASLKGIGICEAQLDVRIERMKMLLAGCVLTIDVRSPHSCSARRGCHQEACFPFR